MKTNNHKTPRKPQRRFEQEMQIQLLKICHLYARHVPDFDRLFHVPNGGARSAVEGAIFKAMGTRKGFPDLELPINRRGVGGANGEYHRLYIELKRPGGKLSEEQSRWVYWLIHEGNCVQVCESVDAAWSILCWYLSPRNPGMRDYVEQVCKPKLTVREGGTEVTPNDHIYTEWEVVDTKGVVWFLSRKRHEAENFQKFCCSPRQ